MFSRLSIVLLSCFLLSCDSNSSSLVEKKFQVYGNCEMCKNTIESALKLQGIETAVWDENSKLLTVKFDSLSTNPTVFLKAVAEAGYDNEAFIANDYAYKNLPECCQYERKEVESL